MHALLCAKVQSPWVSPQDVPSDSPELGPELPYTGLPALAQPPEYPSLWSTAPPTDNTSLASVDF